MKRKRRNHSASFKAKVALAALRILVIPITRSGFIRSPDLPNAMS